MLRAQRGLANLHCCVPKSDTTIREGNRTAFWRVFGVSERETCHDWPDARPVLPGIAERINIQQFSAQLNIGNSK